MSFGQELEEYERTNSTLKDDYVQINNLHKKEDKVEINLENTVCKNPDNNKIAYNSENNVSIQNISPISINQDDLTIQCVPDCILIENSKTADIQGPSTKETNMGKSLIPNVSKNSKRRKTKNGMEKKAKNTKQKETKKLKWEPLTNSIKKTKQRKQTVKIVHDKNKIPKVVKKKRE
uniref:Uncharacterized protein n=1 Tax=Cacopsylla melanoneura TaxID=428564 RepID=A0A8D9B7G6_9HEMI